MSKVKKILIWMWMLTKRYFKNPLFVLTVLAIPMLVMGLRSVSGTDEAIVRVAVYASKDAEESQKLIDNLTGKEGEAVVFYKANNETDMETDIKRGYASCGLVLPDNLTESIKDFVEGNSKALPFDSAIFKYVYTEESNYSKIACEIVFTQIYKAYAGDVLVDYLKGREENANLTEDDLKELKKYYDSYDTVDKVFEFENIDGTKNQMINGEDKGFLVLATKGLIYTLILLAALMGGIAIFRDMQAGVFNVIAYNKRKMMYFLYTLVPAVISGAVGFAGIIISGVGQSAGYEAFTMLLYIILVASVARMFTTIFNSISLYVSVIPIFILMNVVLSNVFVSVTTVFPAVVVVRYFLPVSYGLTGTYNLRNFILAIIVSFCICSKRIRSI